MTILRQALSAMSDPNHAAFQSRSIPNIDPKTILGIRIPQLRKLAKTVDREAFFLELPHSYLEENLLHGILLSQIPQRSQVIAELERFLPYVDNWAVCDIIRPRCFSRDRQMLLPVLRSWLQSSHPYTVRFAIEMLLLHFLQEDFSAEQLQWVASVDNNDYYVNMASAWYFATALAFQYEAAEEFLRQGSLSPWIHQKTLQKAAESLRIPWERKRSLRSLS